MKPQPRYQPGDRIGGRYQVHQALMGGMGEVYLCLDLEHDRPLAVKTFQDRFLMDKATRDRFTQEALIWVRLENHPNIARAYYVDRIEGKPYIFLEMVVGPEGYGAELRSWLRQGPLDLVTALDFALQFCLGMEHAQKKVPGLVHRDIKPENILITQDQLVKITDFGLVKTLEAMSQAWLDPPRSDQPATTYRPSLTRLGAILGTPPYMSPEQCLGQPVDIQSDIYSFGCVLYEMLTGSSPFDAHTPADFLLHHLSSQPRPLHEFVTEISAAVEDLVMRCLSKRAEERPPHFAALRNALASAYQAITGRPAILRLSSIEPELADWINRSHSLFNLGYLESAIAAAETAITLDPSFADAWSNKGVILAHMGRRQEALICYDRAISLKPDYHRALVNKGASLCKLDQPEEAIACLDLVLAAKPRDSWAWHNKGLALSLLGRELDALDCYDQTLRCSPGLPQAWNNRGVSLLNLALQQPANPQAPLGHHFHRLAASLESFLKAVEMDPYYTNAHHNLHRAFDVVLANLPHSYQSERWLWRIVARDEGCHEKLMGKVLSHSQIQLHPRYLMEVISGPLAAILSDSHTILRLIFEVVGKLLSHDMALASLRPQTDARFRLGLHLLNEVLSDIGLLEVPTTTAEVLSPLLETLGETLQVAKSMNNTGIMYRRLSEYESAERCYELALQLYEAAGDRKFCAHVHYNLGVVYENRKDPGDEELARLAFTHAVTIYRDIELVEDARVVSERLDALGNCN